MHHPPEVFDGLKGLVSTNRRDVVSVRKTNIVKAQAWSSERLFFASHSVEARRLWRREWFERVLTTLADCDIVFADPDNGLFLDDRFRHESRKDWKSIPMAEVQALAEGRVVVIYHHNTRFKGGHAAEIAHWLHHLGPEAFAVRVRAGTGRTFFVLNAAQRHKEAASDWCRQFGPKASLLGG